MKSIRIKNLRSLIDTEDVCISAINLLVGKNSSGKSTFLRTFPLFKQTIQERTTAPILFYSRFGIDFGSFKDAFTYFESESDSNSDSDSDSEFLEFSFHLPNLYLKKPLIRYNLRNLSKTIRLRKYKTCIDFTMKVSALDDRPFLQELKINIFGNELEIILDPKVVKHIIANNYELKFLKDLNYSSNAFTIDRMFLNLASHKVRLKEIMATKIHQQIKDILNRTMLDTTVDKIFDQILNLTNIKVFLKQVQSIKKPATWHKNCNKLTIESIEVRELYHSVLIYHLEEVLQFINYYLINTFNRVKYIGPSRATAERYYRIQDLSVNEVDPNGQNLPMFLGSLSQSLLKHFQQWTSDNFDFIVKIKRSEGHYSIRIHSKNGFEINMSDMGFGYSQILPIITQLWHTLNKKDTSNFVKNTKLPTIFVIEQPELHLHPEFQSQFANVIVKVIEKARETDFNLKLIIETHSQVIINRIGLLIAKKLISENDVNVIIFNKENESSPTQIQSARYDEEGELDNWPIGFFSPSPFES